jgi:hypothetical protein
MPHSFRDPHDDKGIADREAQQKKRQSQAPNQPAPMTPDAMRKFPGMTFP